MNPEMDELRGQIDEVIRTLADEYRSAPSMILTEDDLKFLIIHRLLQLPTLRAPRQTVDGVLGTMVHAEVSWFDENGKLRVKPDIAWNMR